MSIYRREALLGGLALAAQTFVGQARAQNKLSQEELLTRQLAGAEASPTDLYTTVDFDRLSLSQPHLQLGLHRKSVGYMQVYFEDLLSVVADQLQRKPIRYLEETGTILSPNVVAFDAHGVVANGSYIIAFSPAPGVLRRTLINVDQNNVDQNLDLAFGTFVDPTFVEKNRLQPIAWGSWNEALISQHPVTVLGYKPTDDHPRLHATLGLAKNYVARLTSKERDGNDVLRSCKGYLTNAAYKGQSGCMALCDKKMIGLFTASVNRKGLQEGCFITPAEAIAKAFALRFPEEAARMGLAHPPRAQDKFLTSHPECRAFLEPH